MNEFADYPDNDAALAEEASLNLRAKEVETLIEDWHERARENIIAAQKRQITAQNNREKVVEDDIHKGDTVYVTSYKAEDDADI